MGQKLTEYYVLFGFCKEDPDFTGYLSDSLKVTEFVQFAKKFYPKKNRGQRGFTFAQKWCDFINSDPEYSNGFIFHPVKLVAKV